MSLRVRHSLIYAASVLCILSLFSTILYASLRHRLLASETQSLLLNMEYEWEHITTHEEHGPDKLSRLLAERTHLRIWEDEKLFYDSFPEAVSVSEPKEKAERQGNYLVAMLSKEEGGHRYKLLAFSDLSSTLRYISMLGTALAFGCLLSVLFILPMSWKFTGSLLDPFEKLGDKTSELSAESLSFRFPRPKRRDEFGRLVENFNELLTRLENTFEHARNFASRASHELRTPLAIIKGEAQFAQKRERSPSEYSQSFASVENQVNLLEKLTKRLLYLADVERRQSAQLVPEKLDPAKLTADCAAAMEKAYAAKQIKFQLKKEGIPYIQACPEVMTSIITNLLENAFKYTTDQVIAKIQTTPTQAILQFEDNGPGIPEESYKVATQPFVKGIHKTPTIQKPGSGLGLSIVKACVQLSRGDLILSASPLGGLRVTVMLPTV